jgi:hypothetical protein
VNELQVSHFVLLFEVDSHNEVERSIPSIDYFVSAVLNERTKGFISRETLPNELSFQGCSFLNCDFAVVFSKTSLSLLIDHKQKLDHMYVIINLLFFKLKILIRYPLMIIILHFYFAIGYSRFSYLVFD